MTATTTPDRRTVLLAAKRSTYLVGPISGPQLAAAIASLVLPVFIAMSGVPGWPWLVILVWQLAAITSIRWNDRNGWQLLGQLSRAHRRSTPVRAAWQPPADVAAIASVELQVRAAPSKPRSLLSSAPGRLARAQVLSVDVGDVFLLPSPNGVKRAGRATSAWRVTGPPYALLTGRDQDTAIERWAGAINRLATLPGLIGLSLHQRSESSTGLTAARAWHDANRDDAVPVAAAEYADLLATTDARDPSSTLAITFDPRKVPGKAAGLADLFSEVPGILAAAGVVLHGSLSAADVVADLVDLARPIDHPPACPPSPIARPVFPAYTEDLDLVRFDGVCHTVVVAITATAVGVTGDVLAPLFAARRGVESSIAITVRPLPTEQTQARARARAVKLRRQRAAAQSSSMSGMLIDTHRIDQEMEVLDALGADSVRGSVETELVITVVLSGSDEARVRAARDGLVRDASPLRFTTVPWAAPTVIFTRAALGGLL